MPSQARFGASVLLTLALCATVSPAALGASGTDPVTPPPPTDSFVPTPSPAPSPAQDLAGNVIPGRVIVRWKTGTKASVRAQVRTDAGTVPARTLGGRDVQLLRLAADQSMGDALRDLRADPRVASAEPDRYLTPYEVPNDPDLPLQWAVHNTGVPVLGTGSAKAGGDIDVVPAWDRTVGTPDTVVAVIDTGYDFLGPDLGAVAWTNPGEIADNGIDDDANGKVDDTRGWDFVGAEFDSPAEDNDPTDDDANGGGHGLHVAGIIGAKGDDGHGITGVAQNVRLMPLRVCTWSTVARSGGVCSVSGAVAAINYAGSMGAKVANLSLGGPEASPAMADAIAANPHTLYVIAAGNSASNNDKSPTYPCSYDPRTDSAVAGRIDNVICVAASDQSDNRATFSNWGAKSVDLAAPGVSIWSLFSSATMWRDNFETDDFDSRWVSSGLGFGRGLAGDGTLASAGLTDSPDSAPEPGLHRVVSVPVAIPDNVEACKVQGQRYANPGDGSTFTYSVLVDGQHDPSLDFSPVASPTVRMRDFQSTPFDATPIAGRSASLEVAYDAADGLDADNGVWMDNLELTCARTSAKPALYEFESGTSMASPMVAGGAALLFSLKPSATVAQVRSALLGGAKRLKQWAGLTATGGRLDVAAAMGRLVPPGTAFTATPVVSGQRISASVAQTGTLSQIRFQCAVDTGAFGSCGQNAVIGGLHPGRHVLYARAVDAWNNPDLTPAAYSFRVDGCLVPRVARNSLARVRAVLPRSGCRLGVVVGPHGVAIKRLRVKASYPAAGAYRPAGTRVKIVLVRR
jgi:subtilisin family serine protease